MKTIEKAGGKIVFRRGLFPRGAGSLSSLIPMESSHGLWKEGKEAK